MYLRTGLILNKGGLLHGVWTQVNPSTPRPESQGLPFDKLKTPSTAEGLKGDAEPRLLTPSLKRGLAQPKGSKKTLEKKKIDEEELPCAYAATVTTTAHEILYECKDCGEKWTETKEETKFN